MKTEYAMTRERITELLDEAYNGYKENFEELRKLDKEEGLTKEERDQLYFYFGRIMGYADALEMLRREA